LLGREEKSNKEILLFFNNFYSFSFISFRIKKNEIEYYSFLFLFLFYYIIIFIYNLYKNNNKVYNYIENNI